MPLQARATPRPAPLVPRASPLRRVLGYRKFHRAQLTILLLDSNYHLHSECYDALKALGHRVVRLPIGGSRGAQHAAAAMQQLLQALVRDKPDMLLTINHIGFDAHNSMGELLEAVQLPTAVWYVDSPFLLFDGYFMPAAAVTTAFVWDKQHVARLRACGASDSYYLPLGCDVKKFAVPATSQTAWPVGFVGNSMTFAAHKWRQLLSPAAQQQGVLLAEQLSTQRPLFMQFLGTPRQAPTPHVTLLAYATWLATGMYRQRFLQAMVKALPLNSLHVFGDTDWQTVLPLAQRHAHVWYGQPLATVYQNCGISFNATSLQMPSAVNQRVFDVPAAGGLVLTDAQEEVFELFAPNEMTVYHSRTELLALLRFYLRHPQARQQRIAAGRRRVLRDHTYVLRLQQLLKCMRQRWQ